MKKSNRDNEPKITPEEIYNKILHLIWRRKKIDCSNEEGRKQIDEIKKEIKRLSDLRTEYYIKKMAKYRKKKDIK